MGNYFYINPYYYDFESNCNIITKFPNAISLCRGRDTYIKGSLIVFYAYSSNFLYGQYYLLPDVQDDDAILYALHGITLIKLPDNAHIYETVERVNGVYNIFYNLSSFING